MQILQKVVQNVEQFQILKKKVLTNVRGKM